MTEDRNLLLAVGARLDAPLASGGNVRSWLARTLLRIRDKRGELVPLRANRVQAEFERRAARANIVLKARQLGITTWMAARTLLATITRAGTVSVLVTHDQDSAEAVFRIVHRFLAHLPERLRDGALATSRANVRQIVFPHLDSEYRVETAADPNAGRGLTIHNLHCSEVARWPRDAAGTLASLRASLVPGGELTLESTPNGAAGCFYDEWRRADETGLARHFFPWWWEDSYAAPGTGLQAPASDERPASSEDFPGAYSPEPGAFSADEQRLVADHDLTETQILFRRQMRARFGRLAPQEFAEDPETCFLASNECVFDLPLLEARLAQCAPPAITRDNGRLRIWWPPQPGRDYIVGVDPAGGGSEGDYACAEVVERETGLQCAELHGHFAPAELARRTVELAREYNRALIAVERNNHGHGVLAHLMTLGYDNLYEQNGQPGWLTSVVTRPQMLAHFTAVLTAAPQLISSDRLLSECRTFVLHPDGSQAAAAGAHDDCIMAAAIALAVRNQLACSRKGTLELGILPVRERERTV